MVLVHHLHGNYRRINIIYLKRKIYNKLLAWKENSNGNTALLIEGAR